uniref:Uncharacterized protein n=1 Tax=Sphaerodactylus townsendi TaxID=933632 RepID=A0ACB8G3Z5_9SAUR
MCHQLISVSLGGIAGSLSLSLHHISGKCHVFQDLEKNVSCSWYHSVNELSKVKFCEALCVSKFQEATHRCSDVSWQYRSGTLLDGLLHCNGNIDSYLKQGSGLWTGEHW